MALIVHNNDKQAQRNSRFHLWTLPRTVFSFGRKMSCIDHQLAIAQLFTIELDRVAVRTKIAFTVYKMEFRLFPFKFAFEVSYKGIKENTKKEVNYIFKWTFSILIDLGSSLLIPSYLNYNTGRINISIIYWIIFTQLANNNSIILTLQNYIKLRSSCCYYVGCNCEVQRWDHFYCLIEYGVSWGIKTMSHTSNVTSNHIWMTENWGKMTIIADLADWIKFLH